MVFRHPSAREWAVDHPAAAEIRLGRLESVAFQRHPDIYRWFGADGEPSVPQATRRPPSAGDRALSWLFGIAAIVCSVLPLAAVAALLGDRYGSGPMDAAESEPLAGVLFGVAAAVQVVVFVWWIATGARWNARLAAVLVVAAAASAVALRLMPDTAAADGFEGWRPWYPFVVVCLVVAGVSAVVMLLRRSARTPETVDDGPEAPEPAVALAAVAVAIAALPAAEHDAIRADRDAALAVLHARGLLDEATLRRALARDLGTLFVLDGPRRGGSA